MNLYLSLLIALISGALFEFGCVYWVHYSERSQAFKASIWSMIVATTTVVGIGESIKDKRVAIAYIIGYGIGTYLAITFKPNRGNK